MRPGNFHDCYCFDTVVILYDEKGGDLKGGETLRGGLRGGFRGGLRGGPA